MYPSLFFLSKLCIYKMATHVKRKLSFCTFIYRLFVLMCIKRFCEKRSQHNFYLSSILCWHFFIYIYTKNSKTLTAENLMPELSFLSYFLLCLTEKKSFRFYVRKNVFPILTATRYDAILLVLIAFYSLQKKSKKIILGVNLSWIFSSR